MGCISPPELRDSDLIAYLDDNSSDEVVRHLDRCEHCRENLRRLAAEEQRLAALLYRSVCPSSETLGEYHLGMLADEPASAVSEHVAGCTHCTEELAQLDDFMGALASDLEFGVIEQMKVLVARLISGGGAGGQMAPALAGLRGGDDGAYVYEAGDAQIVIHVQEGETPDHKTLLGLVSGIEAEPGERLQVHVWRDDEKIGAVPIDELDNFRIPDVPAGTYELIVHGADVEIHIQNVTV